MLFRCCALLSKGYPLRPSRRASGTSVPRLLNATPLEDTRRKPFSALQTRRRGPEALTHAVGSPSWHEIRSFRAPVERLEVILDVALGCTLLQGFCDGLRRLVLPRKQPFSINDDPKRSKMTFFIGAKGLKELEILSCPSGVGPNRIQKGCFGDLSSPLIAFVGRGVRPLRILALHPTSKLKRLCTLIASILDHVGYRSMLYTPVHLCLYASMYTRAAHHMHRLCMLVCMSPMQVSYVFGKHIMVPHTIFLRKPVSLEV